MNLTDTYEDLLIAFEAFKETNDERLKAVEKKLTADVVTTDKLDRLNRAIDELSLKQVRPERGGSPVHSQAAREHKDAFEGYIRRGETAALTRLEGKALSVGSDPDGGYLVPKETEAAINTALKALSPIRAIAGVRQVSASVYKKPFSITAAGTGWVGETDARPQTTSPTLAEMAFPTMELYAMPAATASLIDDAAVNIDEWIAEEVRSAFATQEGTAFVTGNGVNKPKGFLDYTKVAEASWTWGSTGYKATGVAGALPASNASDVLIDLIYALKSGYRANAHWVMNRSTQAVIRKLKDVDGNYLWQPAALPSGMPTLMGFGIAESEDMPDIAANSFSVAFGDFSSGYLIVDRQGIRVLRDPYSSKPYVLFYTTKRVGGGIQDFNAIKLLKFAVS